MYIHNSNDLEYHNLCSPKLCLRKLLQSDVSNFLELKNTNAIIKMCSFQEASTREIAMLTSNDSNVTIEQIDFTSNRGSIISCTARDKTIITITNCAFSNNSVMAVTYNTPSALIHIMNSIFTSC